MMANAESGRGGERSNGSNSPSSNEKMVYKVVLTGGPCAGKTTALVRVSTFFEQIGWKVYMVPEAATILLGGGVRYASLNQAQQKCLNESVLKTMMRIEESFMELARLGDQKKCLVVFDRGTMDPSAFCTEKDWQKLMDENGWNLVSLRDERYDQIVHMQSAAKGAEEFYQVTNNATRSEGLELARELDTKAAQAWVGHPYCDVIDNSTDFENKLKRVIAVICKRLGKRVGGDVDERLKAESKKRKFLIKSVPSKEMFPKRFQDFDVQHDYLQSQDPTLQVRIRKRGQNENFTYTYTERKFLSTEKVELFRKMTKREYMDILKQKDPSHYTIRKLRRCFHWQGHYFQLDIFNEPDTARCKDLVILETYTHLLDDTLKLPSFLSIEREITGEPVYSMYNLSQL